MASKNDVKPMGMYLQDPLLSGLNYDWKFPLNLDFLEGMGSSRFCVWDTDLKGNLIHRGLDWAADELSLGFEDFPETVDNPQFHQVNTFAVAGHTLQFVEEELGRPISWRSGEPLVLRPHAFEGANAYYDPASNSLNFGYFTSPFQRTPVWTCLSHDIISHELGHAILDNFRPLFLYSSEIDTAALHESLGDLLAMFSALEHPQVVQAILKETDRDLRSDNIIAGLAEQFGVGLTGASYPYLRSALHGLQQYDPSTPSEPHERSTIWGPLQSTKSL